jgi:hypothetical protein
MSHRPAIPQPENALQQDAQRLIAPILLRGNAEGSSAAMFRAATELQKRYPGLKPHEIEAHLRRAMKSA